MKRMRVIAEHLEFIFGTEELFELPLVNSDPWSLAQKVGVTILSDKELLASVVDFDESRVIAAVFNAYTPESYSFDTVVDPKYQRRGLGKELIQLAMDEYSNLQEAYPDLKLDLDVINPDIIPFLEREYNLEVKEQQGGHYIMGKLRVTHKPRLTARTYYQWDHQSIPEIIDSWVNGAKLYDSRPHGYYPIKDLLPYREYVWTKNYSRQTNEEWEALKQSLRETGWNPEEPIYIQIDKNGNAKVGEGNHRLAIANELIESEGNTELINVPVMFEFRENIINSTMRVTAKPTEEQVQ